MKNFNMPEFVSPTLESDQLKRLHKSIQNIVSKEEADIIINEIPLANNSTPEERASRLGRKINSVTREQV